MVYDLFVALGLFVLFCMAVSFGVRVLALCWPCAGNWAGDGGAAGAGMSSDATAGRPDEGSRPQW